MTIDEFLDDPKLVAQYKKWITQPIGEVILGLLRKHFLRPIQPGQLGQVLNECSASFCLGENAGSWKIHDALENFQNIKEIIADVPAESYAKPEDEREPEPEKK